MFRSFDSRPSRAIWRGYVRYLLGNRRGEAQKRRTTLNRSAVKTPPRQERTLLLSPSRGLRWGSVYDEAVAASRLGSEDGNGWLGKERANDGGKLGVGEVIGVAVITKIDGAYDGAGVQASSNALGGPAAGRISV